MKNKLIGTTKKKIRFDNATYFGETIGNEITGLGIISNDDVSRQRVKRIAKAALNMDGVAFFVLFIKRFIGII